MAKMITPRAHRPIQTWINRISTLLIVVWFAVQFWPIWIRPGPRTTVISGPARSDGSVDFAAALNAECSAGLTPDDNAAVLLLRILGPEIFDNVFDDAEVSTYYKLLGIEPLPREGAYFRTRENVSPYESIAQNARCDDLDDASMTPWSPSKYPELERWLVANDEALQRCLEAVRKDRFFDPIVRPKEGSLIDIQNPLAQATRPISRLLRLLVTRHLRDHNVADALLATQTMHRLSRLLAQHPLMNHQFLANGHSAAACASDEVILRSGQLSAEQSRRYREFLMSLSPMPSAIELVNHGERFAILDAMQVQFLTAEAGFRSLQPNTFLMTVNEGLSKYVSAMKEPDVASQRRAIDMVRKTLDQETKLRLADLGTLIIYPRGQMSTMLAKISSNLQSPACDQIIRSQVLTSIRYQLTCTAYALVEYRAMHGQFPTDLRVLVPDNLPQVPIDPFSGAPIRYTRDPERGSFLVHSVGENGIDDHGRKRETKQGDDIAVEIALAE
ncbi:hypothetical protein [Schlesneria paludicola]|uniref:hypothetical protein n=1 Tax=Schlesneria paludicola TaxID=360056 RepID=UPI00029A8A4B|nr:hypothetical protein [Schlesneria paludicola]